MLIMNDKDSNNIRRAIPCDRLCQLYVNEAKADAEIASMFKVSTNSIFRRRQDCGIPTRKGYSDKQSKNMRIRLDREHLRHLYVDLKKNENEVAAIMGCDFRTVKKNLADYGIEIKKTAHLHDKIDRDSLRRMYAVDKRSDASIAKEFGVSFASISNLRKRYGIKSRVEQMRSRVNDADLRGMYNDKRMSPSDIADSLGCSLSVMYDRLKMMGVTLREDHSKERGAYLKWCKMEGQRCKQEIKSALGGRCQICDRLDAKQFHIHHMCYVPDDIIYDNYKVKDEYYMDLHPIVMKEIWRFRLLCGTCHSLLGPLPRWPVEQTHRMINVLSTMDEKRHAYPTRYEQL